MIEQTNALLNHEWTPDERVLIKRLVDSLLYYKYLIPKNLKSDVVAILDMANNIKHEYTILKGNSTPNSNPNSTIKSTPNSTINSTPNSTIKSTPNITLKRRNSC